MNVVHRTRARHLVAPLISPAGHEVLAVVLKYSYRVGPRGDVSALRGDDAVAPRPCDIPSGDDLATSSIAKPGDLCDEKPGTEVLLIGHAYPARATDKSVDVRLEMGPIQKTLRVHGLRVWQRGTFGGLSPGPALAMGGPVALRYELAWGGLDLTDPAKPVGEPGNTLGRGVARDPASLIGKAAAQIEYVDEPVGGRKNVVAGFGALHRHWAPRARFAGTYDARWESVRMPVLPEDFDPRFWVSAPHDQWTARPLRGDEPITIDGATPEGAWRFRLPAERPKITTFTGGVRREHATHVDCVLIDCDARVVEATFRVSVPLPAKIQQLSEVRITDGT